MRTILFTLFVSSVVAASIPPGVVSAQTMYGITIQKDMIRASSNSNVVELKLKGDSLVVTKLPPKGFFAG